MNNEFIRNDEIKEWPIAEDERAPDSTKKVCRKTLEWFDRLYENNEPETKKVPSASELFVTYFILGATGIKLPENDDEQIDFVKSFMVSTALKGGKQNLPSENVGHLGFYSNIAAFEISNAKLLYDEQKKAQLEKEAREGTLGETKENEKESDYDLELRRFNTFIEEKLKEYRLSDEELIAAKTSILKSLAIECLKKVQSDSGTIEPLEKAQECFKAGNNAEASKQILLALNSLENHTDVEQLIERLCNDWNDYISEQ